LTAAASDYKTIAVIDAIALSNANLFMAYAKNNQASCLSSAEFNWVAN